MTIKIRHGKRIRKGDKVYVITGNDRGQTGTVLSHLGEKVIVQGLNVKKKHVKKSQENPSGGIVNREAPIHISNVKLCVLDDKAVKVKVKTDDNGERQMYYHDGDREIIYRSVKEGSK